MLTESVIQQGRDVLEGTPPKIIEAASAIYPKCLLKSALPLYLAAHASLLSRIVDTHHQKDWTTYVLLHQDAYKVFALREAARCGLKSEAYWSILRDAWSMLHHVHIDRYDWLRLFSRHVGAPRRTAMTAAELEVYDALPDPVTLYRGARPTEMDGIAWTTDLNVAQFFADRLSNGRVYQITIPKARALMYLADRDEAEVIIELSYGIKPIPYLSSAAL